MESFHKFVEFLACHLLDFLRIPWPLEVSVLSTLVKEQVSITFPDKSFDLVAPATTEKEQGAIFKRIHAELELYQFREAVDSKTEVSIPTFNVDFLKLVRVTKHASSPLEREKGFHPMTDKCILFNIIINHSYSLLLISS